MKIYIMGDIHGKFQPVRDFWLRSKLEQKISSNREDNALILLGDAGLNYFFNHRDREFKAKLSKYPFTYFVVRGNHEERASVCAEKNPDSWHTEIFWGEQVLVENDYPYIKYACDGPGVYEIPCEDKIYKTLVLPGAYSVDKGYRIYMGYAWFEQEQMSPTEMNFAWDLSGQNNNSFDLILSHTCPIIFEPIDLFLPMVDQNLVDKSMERFLGSVEYHVNYKAWLWGHYHANRDYPRTDGKRKTMLFQNAINLNDYMNEDEVRYL